MTAKKRRVTCICGQIATYLTGALCCQIQRDHESLLFDKSVEYFQYTTCLTGQNARCLQTHQYQQTLPCHRESDIVEMKDLVHLAHVQQNLIEDWNTSLYQSCVASLWDNSQTP